jgi:hypothetical protein
LPRDRRLKNPLTTSTLEKPCLNKLFSEYFGKKIYGASAKPARPFPTTFLLAPKGFYKVLKGFYKLFMKFFDL